MLEVIDFVLRSGIKISLSFATGLILLDKLGMPGFRKYLWRGLAGAFSAGLLGAYPLKLFKLREEFDVISAAFTLMLCLAVFVFMGRARTMETERENQRRGPPARMFIFSAGFFLPLRDIMEIVLFSGGMFLAAKGYLHTGLILKAGLVIPGAGLAVFLGKLFTRVTRILDKDKTCLLGFAIFITLAAGSLIRLASGALLLGLFPVTARTVSLIAPLINYEYLTLYGFLFALGAGILMASLHQQNENYKNSPGLNPAQKRKMRAAGLARDRWITSGYLALATVLVLTGARYFYGDRKTELSPAEQTVSQGGVIFIPLESVSDGNLHRFLYTTAEGHNVRFIVIQKREGVFGVGFDACEICGARGYYQRKRGEIVCLACDTVMNIDTIGFPGGCNPIPLSYRKEGDFLLVQVSDIERREKEFGKK